MRSIENKAEKERSYQDDLIDLYIRRYAQLAKQMTQEYKRLAINNFLTEMYCKQQDGGAEGSISSEGAVSQKFVSKHKSLIEKALYGETNWYKLREQQSLILDKQMQKVKQGSLPFSIKQAAE